jgi:hypothetical protein
MMNLPAMTRSVTRSASSKQRRILRHDSARQRVSTLISAQKAVFNGENCINQYSWMTRVVGRQRLHKIARKRQVHDAEIPAKLTPRFNPPN